MAVDTMRPADAPSSPFVELLAIGDELEDLTQKISAVAGRLDKALDAIGGLLGLPLTDEAFRTALFDRATAHRRAEPFR